MKFNPGRENDPFLYKGYEAWVRRADNEWLTCDAIEIRLVRRHTDRSKTMIIRFLIKDRASLFKCLHRAITALKKAELEEQTNV